MKYEIIATTPSKYGTKRVRRITVRQMVKEQIEHARWATSYCRGYPLRWCREEYWFLPREACA